MTEYEYEYYSAFQKWPNTNTNIIRLSKMTEYEYEYYSAFQKWPNTNTNIIRLPKNFEVWKHILKCLAEKSQTNANSVSMQSCMHTIQVNIWIRTVGKIFTNANNVILHFWSKEF